MLKSMPNPALASLDSPHIKWQNARFDGRFMTESIYRRNASAEVDQAWDALGINCERVLLNIPPIHLYQHTLQTTQWPSPPPPAPPSA